MRKNSGFTLAEVLITLGIIGVVAALTMPTLMSSTQGAQYKAAYKKALSALNQMVTLNVALDDFNFAETPTGGTLTGTGYATNMYGMIKARMNVVKTSATTTGYAITEGGTAFTQNAANNYTMFFNDGIAFSFPVATGACVSGPTQAHSAYCKGFIDVNGAKAPNKIVTGDNCTTGSTNCVVTNPTDVYPVVFYDQTLLPNSEAARAVLYGK
ncbi:MAG: type II secretion system GspH family protein [Heliobacteriaceae bacterium]|jgi:prepilin-type N-terminal cleavage/methylation domain-containing protein|nr:type II secretion system GspH family protein [Heliobacteriaceae bacterium]